jgi:hypothetical protein
MSKNQTSTAQTAPATTEPVKTKKGAPPVGYAQKTDDVVGFADLEKYGPLHGIPRGAKLSDGGIDPEKPSSFIIFELLEDCEVNAKDGETDIVVPAKKGEMVGLWTKPGMKGLRSLCGCKVWIAYKGQKNIGKPSPMKVYDIRSPDKGGATIPIIEDNRDKSRAEKTFLDSRLTQSEVENLPF